MMNQCAATAVAFFTTRTAAPPEGARSLRGIASGLSILHLRRLPLTRTPDFYDWREAREGGARLLLKQQP